tara:strand:- start:370 stop:540 length:171 start_codon:yes stop_codon:yes gene_type:complete
MTAKREMQAKISNILQQKMAIPIQKVIDSLLQIDDQSHGIHDNHQQPEQINSSLHI